MQATMSSSDCTERRKQQHMASMCRVSSLSKSKTTLWVICRNGSSCKSTRTLNFFVFTKLLLSAEWLKMTSWLLDKFKCCCKYCSTLCFGKGNYGRWSKQKCDGPSGWSVFSGIRPNMLNFLLYLGSNVWMSWTLKEEMIWIFNSIITFAYLCVGWTHVVMT